MVELLSHKTLCNIVDLQKLAMSMTREEFIAHIMNECDDVRDSDYYIDFDYRNLTATINKSNNTLSGSIDIWDEDRQWCDTFFCQCVSFKN